MPVDGRCKHNLVVRDKGGELPLANETIRSDPQAQLARPQPMRMKARLATRQSGLPPQYPQSLLLRLPIQLLNNSTLIADVDA